MNTSQKPVETPETDRRGLLHLSLQRADEHYAKGNLPAARDFLEMALSLAPESLEILTSLGNLEYQLERYESARTIYQRAIAIQPNQSVTHTRLAAVHAALKQTGDFEQAIKAALDLDPENLEAIKLLAHYLFENRCFRDAAELYNCVVKRTPDDIPALLVLGKCLYKLDALEAAQAVFEHVLELDPTHPIASENLALIKSPHPVAGERGVSLSVEQGLTSGQPFSLNEVPHRPVIAALPS